MAKRVGVLTPASGRAAPPGVGEMAAIPPEVVGVGVAVDVALGGLVGVALTPGGKVGEGVVVRVEVGVNVGELVGVTVPVTVGVGVFSVSVKASEVQAIVLPVAPGSEVGAVGATGWFLNW